VAVRKGLIGSALGLATTAALVAILIPLRSHVSIATTGLVLVIPVVVGVTTGGIAGGLVSVTAGFLAYDYFFIPPYYTLNVGVGENWAALGVYAVVMVVVAQLVAHFDAARAEATRREVEVRRIFELSEALVGEQSAQAVFDAIVTAVRDVFGVSTATLLLESHGHLAVAASSGEPLTDQELRRLEPSSGVPVSVATSAGRSDAVRTVALTAGGRPVGILALRGLSDAHADHDLLQTFTNHAALALERTQLRAEVLRTELLVQVDRLRSALLGAVSHDLRTPLSTMKVASTTLLDPDASLTSEDRHELYELVDLQTDRLTRLVTSLLDLTRYQAGVLEADRIPVAVLDLVASSVADLRTALGDREIDLAISASLPEVTADPVLVGQVLANLLDNAHRHGPPGTPITVSATADGDSVSLSVHDEGDGVPPDERESVFESFQRFDQGGRAGLGLSIAKTFVEAHGGRIWVDGNGDGGATFTFTLPVAAVGD
jgi:two-component system sensor histidine kinase KdpD